MSVDALSKLVRAGKIRSFRASKVRFSDRRGPNGPPSAKTMEC